MSMTFLPRRRRKRAWPQLKTASDRELAREQTANAIAKFVAGGGAIKLIKPESKELADDRYRAAKAKIYGVRKRYWGKNKRLQPTAA